MEEEKRQRVEEEKRRRGVEREEAEGSRKSGRVVEGEYKLKLEMINNLKCFVVLLLLLFLFMFVQGA